MSKIEGEGLISVAKAIKDIIKKYHSNDKLIKKILYIIAKSGEITANIVPLFTGWGAIIICLDTLREAIVECTKD